MIKTRFCPSPTGYLHLGNARTALFSALYALRHSGIFLLRIEDTDVSRSEKKFTEALQKDLHWMGIDWQEGPEIPGENGPYFQSERSAIYATYYAELAAKKLAYPCFCTDEELQLQRKLQLSRGQPPRYSGKCRGLSQADIEKKLAEELKPALRFEVPKNISLEFIDLVKGPQKFNSTDIGDFIIQRADGGSSFLFCNAIDDSLMGVTHVLRGEDHLANTPRQLLIAKALGLRTPQYGHIALITSDDQSPLSKRGGSFSLHDLKQQGFLAHAVLNYLARLGHTYAEQKLQTFEQLAQNFSLEALSRGSARFDYQQLLYWQKEAVAALSVAEMEKWLGAAVQQKIPEKQRDLFIQTTRQNIVFPHDASKWAEIFFADEINFHDEQKQILKSAGEKFFVTALESVKTHGVQLKAVLDELKTSLNISGKNLFMPLRVALTGEIHGPELAPLAALLGEEKIKLRLQTALKLVQGA